MSRFPQASTTQEDVGGTLSGLHNTLRKYQRKYLKANVPKSHHIILSAQAYAPAKKKTDFQIAITDWKAGGINLLKCKT